MAWEEHQKVMVESCDLDVHNTCLACCQHKNLRPVARQSAPDHAEFSQEGSAFACTWIWGRVEVGESEREWR